LAIGLITKAILKWLPAQFDIPTIDNVGNVVIDSMTAWSTSAIGLVAAATGSLPFEEYQRGECTLLARRHSGDVQ
jgi:hypothetical protein